MIAFSRRELVKAWRQAYSASTVNPRTNAHRLLLFYAQECGLKAVILKRQNKELLDQPVVDENSARQVAHDLNKLLDILRAGRILKLPTRLNLPSLNTANKVLLKRTCETGEINQAWRYGGVLNAPFDDQALELALEKVNKWLEGELR